MKYLVIDDTCKCDLKVLGEYDTWNEAVEAATLFESCGIPTKIVKGKKNE